MVTQLVPEPEPVPREVSLTQDDLRAPRFTPRELHTIKSELGKTFAQVVADDDSDDRLVVVAWLKLRRDGHEVAFAEMEDVVIALDVVPPDPTNEPPPTTSPRSAATGE